VATLAGTQDISRSQGRGAQSAGQPGFLDRNENQVVRGLGWFSIGLGLAELIAPGAIARLVGTRNHASLIRSYGLREIAAGVGLLATSRRAEWMWARVGGDMLDLASLGTVVGSEDNDRGKAIFGIASVAAVTALDICCAKQLSGFDKSGAWARAEGNMIVNRSPEECYRYWHDFENLPRFMDYLKSVRTMGDGVWHWIAKGPADTPIEWDSELTDDVPNQRIAWRSVGNSDVWHAGSVDFEPAAGARGTVVRVQIDYGHAFRALEPIARMIGKHPEQIVRKELRRFKQVMEVGEVITTEGQPSGRTSGATWLDRIAR
jgi:uncharacterized membrane protein